MRFSTIITGVLFGLEAAAIRVGPIQAGQIAAEVRAISLVDSVWRNKRVAEEAWMCLSSIAYRQCHEPDPQPYLNQSFCL